MAEDQKEEQEEYRTDRAVKISRKIVFTSCFLTWFDSKDYSKALILNHSKILIVLILIILRSWIALKLPYIFRETMSQWWGSTVVYHVVSIEVLLNSDAITF